MSTFSSNILYEFRKKIKLFEDISLNIDNAASLPTLACIEWGLQTQRVCLVTTYV